MAITDPERNYHIFYQTVLCAAAGALSGKKCEDMHLLNQSKCIKLERKDDNVDYKEARTRSPHALSRGCSG